jgi:5-formyltetrahydrofolate cyclo-ligase
VLVQRSKTGAGSAVPRKLRATLTDSKQEFRLLARERAKNLGQAYREKASLEICSHLTAFAEEAGVSRVFVYFGVSPEVETKAFLEDCLERGVRVFLPVCLDECAMEFYETSTLPEKTGRYHIPEPEALGNPGEPRASDLFIVPALALGRDGRRIGHGGGYYDRYLARYPLKPVGLCFDALLFDRLPSAGHDIPVGTIITETGVQAADVG